MHLREWVNEYFARGYSLLPAYQVELCVFFKYSSLFECERFAATGSIMRVEVTCWNAELLVCVLSDLLGE
jgi:hypothetical protein